MKHKTKNHIQHTSVPPSLRTLCALIMLHWGSPLPTDIPRAAAVANNLPALLISSPQTERVYVSFSTTSDDLITKVPNFLANSTHGANVGFPISARAGALT